MALARITQLTAKRLFGFGDGCHNLALTQRKKYQLPLETSGFRPFRKWSCYETNLNQTVTFLSQISLSPSPPRSVCRAHSLSTVVNHGIGHRGKQYCQSNPSQLRPKHRGLWLTKCAPGMRSYQTLFNKQLKENNRVVIGDAIKKATNGATDTVSDGNEDGGKRKRELDTDSDNGDAKRLKLKGESNLNGTISADALANDMTRDLAVHVDLEKKGDGEYVLNIRRVTRNSAVEDKVEMAEQMAQKAAVLLFYGEMLLDMGNKMRAQSTASLCSAFQRPAPSNSDSN